MLAVIVLALVVVARAQTGLTISLSNVEASLYLGEVSFGGVVRRVIFDSGSANVWIAGDFASATQRALPGHFDITYGSGRVSGAMTSDVVQLAGVTLESLPFGVATHVELDIVTNAHGILGLAFSPVSVHPHLPTFLDELRRQYPQMPTAFAFHLTRNAGEVGSAVSFGDDALALASTSTGKPQKWVSVASPAYWSTQVLAVDVDNVRVLTTTTTAATAVAVAADDDDHHNQQQQQQQNVVGVVDSGTSFLGIPRQAYQRVMAAILANAPQSCKTASASAPAATSTAANGGRSFVVCTFAAWEAISFPTISITFAAQHNDGDGEGDDDDTVTLVLQPSDYVQCTASLLHTSCAPLVLPVDSDKFATEDLVLVLGTPVLRAYTTIFDASNHTATRIGFVLSQAPLTIPPWRHVLWRRLCLLLLVVLHAYAIVITPLAWWLRRNTKSASNNDTVVDGHNANANTNTTTTVVVVVANPASVDTEAAVGNAVLACAVAIALPDNDSLLLQHIL